MRRNARSDWNNHNNHHHYNNHNNENNNNTITSNNHFKIDNNTYLYLERYDNNMDIASSVQEIANDYSEMYNASAHNPIKDILNQLLMFGEEEGVLVTTAIQKLYECNKEYKEGV